MNLIALALTTYTEGTAAQAEKTAALAEEWRVEFLAHADSCARGVLNSSAESLDWQYVTAGLPDETEEARALLAPGRPEYLRYRVSGIDDHQVSFDLVQPCRACGHDRITLVTSLFHLGALLHEPQHPAAETDQEPKEEPGPLAATQALEPRTVAVTGLVRRLLAEHPAADLTVQHVSLFGHYDGTSSVGVHLEAADVSAAHTVATALGTSLTNRFAAQGAPYPAVFEHARAKTEIDGIEVELTAYTKLTDDEAAAWRAQQDQAPEAGEE